jgi:formylglycine-generating enzyme required for sulfatase activity
MIAISYRREDSLPTAGRLYDRLQAKFGKENVFMDFDSIPPGMDFREQIKQMIERSNLVIAIIGSHWLGEQSDASRRIDNPADFVRLEIAYALKRGIPIIPVLVNNTPMPPPEKLPQEIEGLAFRNALMLDTGIDFHHHADRLIMGIGRAMDVAPRLRGPRKVPEPTAAPAAKTRPLRRIVTWSPAILLTVAASALVVWYAATHRRAPAKQVETQKESNRASVESATTRPVIVKPPMEQSSPPQLVSEQPKSIVEQSSQPQMTKAPRLDFGSITKQHPYVNSLGMKFVPVPGTRVLFSIWETRVKDFEAFVEATKYDVPGEMYAVDDNREWAVGRTWKDPGFAQTGEHPVCGVSLHDATAFCEWLTERERKAGRITSKQSYRLPSDEEWSVAVGLEKESGSTPEERNGKVKGVYPWGTKVPPPSGAGNYAGSEARTGGWMSDWVTIDGYRDGYARTSPVGSFEANGYGIYDLGGNVREWCQDWWNAEKKFRVSRGASWVLSFPGDLLSSRRFFNSPENRADTVGFRCGLSELEMASTKDNESSAPLESRSPTASPNNIGAQKLTRVRVKKYGFSVLLPTELFPDAAAKLADSNTDRLVSVNGCFRAAFNVLSGPVKKVYDNWIAEFRKKANHTTIDYKVLKDTWFVVSGDSDTTGYYIKGVKRGDNVIVMELEYTGSACNIPDAMLTEISRKFDGN